MFPACLEHCLQLELGVGVRRLEGGSGAYLSDYLTKVPYGTDTGATSPYGRLSDVEAPKRLTLAN